MNVKKHDTILIAWNSDGEVEYCRTFLYKEDEKEKEAAQSALNFVSQNYTSYIISDVNHLLHTKCFAEGRL